MKHFPFYTTKENAERLAQSVPVSERLRGKVVPSRGPGVRTNTASVLVKTPSGGIPARSGTTLGKADCTIQSIDKSTDGVSDGNTVSVYNPSETEIAGDIYVSAIRIRRGSYIVDTAGVAPLKPEICNFVVSGLEFQVSTTEAEDPLPASSLNWTNSEVYGSTDPGQLGEVPTYPTLKKAGLYTVDFPACVDEDGNRTSFNVTDDLSTVRTFYKSTGTEFTHRIGLADTDSIELGNLWNNLYVISEKWWPERILSGVDTTDFTRNVSHCHTGTFYLPQTQLSQFGSICLVSMIQHVNSAGSANISVNAHYAEGTTNNWPNRITYWGDYSTSNLTEITVLIPAQGAGPL